MVIQFQFVCSWVRIEARYGAEYSYLRHMSIPHRSVVTSHRLPPGYMRERHTQSREISTPTHRFAPVSSGGIESSSLQDRRST